MRQWRYRAFAELTTAELYALLRLRQEVFVVEQRCAYLDADGLDAAAAHLFCVDGDHDGDGLPPRLIACARLFAPGVRGDAAVIGRVVSAPALRGTGIGKELMARALFAIAERHGAVAVRLGAQKYLERFYAGFGFVRDGDDYLEDDILHVPMVRPAG
jgi:ElaA protein